MDQVDWQSLPKKERRKLKRELEQEEKEKKESKKKLAYWLIGLLAIGLLLLGGWFLVKELTKPLPGEQMPEQGRNHVKKEEWEKFSYNSNPPTSGPHDPVWTKAGVYDAPQGEGNLIHSLEHGYIIMHYLCQNDKGVESKECRERREQLAKVYEDKGKGKLIVVPRSNLDTNFALTAWRRIDKFDNFDRERISRFVDAHRNHGPEQTIE